MKKKITEDDLKTADSIINSKEKIFLLQYQNIYEKNNTLFKIIEDCVKKNKQVLFLVPKLSEIDNLLSVFPKKIADFGVSVLNNKLYRQKNKFFQEWSDIRFNKKKIIIGTRSALFAPFAELGLIIIDNENELDYKQYDQNPRYHAVDAAKTLVKIIPTKLILTSQSPSLETYYFAKKGKYQNFVQNSFDYKNNIEMIDLGEETKKKNFSYLSEYLLECIYKNLEEKKQVVLFLQEQLPLLFRVHRYC